MAISKAREFAELIGIIAIVVSLGAVAYELRQTQSALVAATYQARAFDAINEALTIGDSGELIRVLVATDSGGDFEAVAALNAEDRERLRHFLRARMVDWDNEWYQYQNGYLDEDFYRTTTLPSIQRYAPRWRNIGHTEPRTEYRAFVDELLAQPD